MSLPSTDQMMYIIHHVFLPPKLPEKSDSDPDKEAFLLGKLLDTLDIFKSYVSGDEAKTISSVTTMIRRLKDSHTTSECVSEDSLKTF